jgi:hypothetical protein
VKIAAVQRSLFTTYFKMESSKYNVSQKVADVLTSYLIIYYPMMKTLGVNELVVRRQETAAVDGSTSVAEQLVWSSHLATYKRTKQSQEQEQPAQGTNQPEARSSTIEAVSLTI